MKKFENRKGEITTQQIVILVVLIASFAVILFLVFRLNIGETSDKQICHNSVVLKSKGGIVGGELDCKTNYVCISGGDDCTGIPTTISSEVNPNDKEDIMKAIADELDDCWWMFGEGQIKYGSTGKTSCALCSVIMFDREILNKNYKISYGEFYEYLSSINKTESQSFFTYLYGYADYNKFQEEASQLSIDLDNDFILESGRYDVVTGVQDKIIGEDVFLRPYYVKLDKLSNLNPSCSEFVTDAQ